MVKLRNISYSYPHSDKNVLSGLDYHISPGDVVLVTGASGCGKSTFMRCLNGLVPHFFQGELQGEVFIDGTDSRDENIPEIACRVGSLFQDPEQQFFTLDVESEIAFGHEQRGVEAERINSIITRMAERLGISHILKSSLFTLSEGEKQKTALASTLSMKPKAILLDEPTANLDHESTLTLAGFVRDLKEEGITVIIVDHRLYWLDGIVDATLIMKEGRIVRQCAFKELYNKELRKEFGLRSPDIKGLNRHIEGIPSTEAWTGDAVTVSGLTFGYKGKDLLFENDNFRFPMGKVSSIIGHNGCGKTTLARLMTGLSKLKTGDICVASESLSTKQLCKRAGLVFQNSDHQLFMSTVLEEMETAGMKIRKRERRKKAVDLLTHFNLKDSLHAHPQSLSGGQKQRLVIACALMKEPDILILDEPTSGLDGKNMSVIAHTLEKIGEEGSCVILITHDLELIASASDYILNLGEVRNGTPAK